jgi:hypothetical protein
MTGCSLDTSNNCISGVLFYFDGVTWTAVGAPAEPWLGSIWGRSDADLYLVGGGHLYHRVP